MFFVFRLFAPPNIPDLDYADLYVSRLSHSFIESGSGVCARPKNMRFKCTVGYTEQAILMYHKQESQAVSSLANILLYVS